MNKIKLTYVRPTTDLLVIRFEEGLLTVSGQQNTIKNATIDTWEEEL